MTLLQDYNSLQMISAVAFLVTKQKYQLVTYMSVVEKQVKTL
jgi:hypothetical protein